MNEISVVILTKNEEKNIEDCINSIPKSWEIVLIDDKSTDNTLQKAKSVRQNTKIYLRSLENDFASQRNFGLKNATRDWVLFLDADERLNSKLVDELEKCTRQNIRIAFKIRRRDHMWGTTLEHGELANIWLTRFARKGSGLWNGHVHETWDVGNRVSRLESTLDHYPHQTIYEFLKEINYYSTIRSQELHDKNTKNSRFDIFVYPVAKFIQNYVFRKGFKDGIPGLIYAVLMSFHSFLVRGKLKAKKKVIFLQDTNK